MSQVTEDPLLKFFRSAGLEGDRFRVSLRFEDLAGDLGRFPRNPERTVALRKLLEARDAMLRSLTDRVAA